MESGEVVLSDVHISTHYDLCDQPEKDIDNSGDEEKLDGRLAVSRFIVTCKSAQEERPISLLSSKGNNPAPEFGGHQEPGEKMLQVDEDGDLDVTRHQNDNESDRRVITLVHHLATGLENVGLQVWQGALLLCDYIQANEETFTGHVMLDLGAGVGLTSIVAAFFAKTVFSTDLQDNILELTKHNSDRNNSNFVTDLDSDRSQKYHSPIKVRKLDWMKHSFPQLNKDEYESSEFNWSSEDLTELKSLQTIIAADVIYDDDLTDGFFRTFHRLMSEPPAKTLYISLEKRMLFTVTDLEVACPAYSHFLECVEDLRLCTDNGLIYQAEKLPGDFAQSFHYNRVPQLEIWKITSRFDTSSIES